MSVAVFPYSVVGSLRKAALTSYADVHADATATVETTLKVDNSKSSVYIIQRSFVSFDTTDLAETPTSINFWLYTSGGANPAETDAGQATIDVCTGHQSTPLVAADYGGAVNEGVAATSLFGQMAVGGLPSPAGMFSIGLSSDSFPWINLSGTTLFCLRADGDVSVSSPTDSNYVGFQKISAGYGTFSPPNISTVTNIGDNSATINLVEWLGITSPQLEITYVGAALTYPRLYVKYGKSSGSLTETSSYQSGMAIYDEVAITLTGLDKDTTYYCRSYMDLSAVVTLEGALTNFTTSNNKIVTGLRHIYNRKRYDLEISFGGVSVVDDFVTPKQALIAEDLLTQAPVKKEPVKPAVVPETSKEPETVKTIFDEEIEKKKK